MYRSTFDELFNVFSDFDSLFRSTFAEVAPAFRTDRALTSGAADERPLARAGRRAFLPAVESYVKDGRIVLRAELAGVDPKDVQIDVTGDVLTISGEKKTDREVDEKSSYFRESRYGRFERSFTLPEGVRSDQIQARFENGVLELSMPSPAHEEPKKVRIEITSEPSPKQVKAA